VPGIGHALSKGWGMPTPVSSPRPPPPEPRGLSRGIAHVLDSLFKLPGSKLRIGLDPVIGLIPGVGDAVASAIGSIILLEAMRAGAPRLLVMRMAANVLVNAAVGAIPVAGDLFSVWFRSNAKNYALLRAWQTGGQKPLDGADARWANLGCGILVVVAVGLGALVFWMIAALWRWMTG